MDNVTKIVSEYGFQVEVARPCQECGHMPHMLIVNGDENGKFAAYQVECPNCLNCTPLAIFFKYDNEGNLVKVNPFARELAEAYWNCKPDRLPPSPPMTH